MNKINIKPPRSRRKTTAPVQPEEHDESKQEEVTQEQQLPSELERFAQKAAHHLEKSNSNDADDGEDDDEDGEDNEGNKKIIYSDRFILTCDNIEPFRIKGIELPKMLFLQHRNTQTIKEKSNLMVYLYTIPKENYPYKKLFEACKKESIKFSIKWLDEKGNVGSEWSFGSARIHGIDFGNAIYERSELPEAALEINYQTINIDGIEF
jgi:hypothetical protein